MDFAKAKEAQALCGHAFQTCKAASWSSVCQRFQSAHPYGAEVGGLGLHEALQRKERDPHAEVGLSVLRIYADGGLVALQGLLMAAPSQKAPEISPLQVGLGSRSSSMLSSSDSEQGHIMLESMRVALCQ